MPRIFFSEPDTRHESFIPSTACRSVPVTGRRPALGELRGTKQLPSLGVYDLMETKARDLHRYSAEPGAGVVSVHVMLKTGTVCRGGRTALTDWRTREKQLLKRPLEGKGRWRENEELQERHLAGVGRARVKPSPPLHASHPSLPAS